MGKIFAYFTQYGNEYMGAAAEHFTVSAVSIAVAVCVGIPLGILCSGKPVIQTVVTGFFSTLRVIPSLAVLFLCIPIIGTGVRSAVIALSVLAMPSILVNTALAFRSIPKAVLETATAMGMSRRRTFFLVKVPLSLPLVLAGLKTATVEVIASATLAAYIGAGGLGTIIFTGLGLLRTDLLLIGGTSVAVFSIAADFLLTRLERRVTRYQEIL
jgi:osmoprotectant transport system permease protein